MQIDSGMNVYEACIAEKKNSPKLRKAMKDN